MSNLNVAELLNTLLQRPVVYIDDNDDKVVFDGELRGKYSEWLILASEERISEILVFFDQKHITGTDIKLPLLTRALVLINHTIGLRNFGQGVYRMRQINKGQYVTIGMNNIMNDKVKGLTIEYLKNREFMEKNKGISVYDYVNSHTDFDASLSDKDIQLGEEYTEFIKSKLPMIEKVALLNIMRETEDNLKKSKEPLQAIHNIRALFRQDVLSSGKLSVMFLDKKFLYMASNVFMQTNFVPPMKDPSDFNKSIFTMMIDETNYIGAWFKESFKTSELLDIQLDKLLESASQFSGDSERTQQQEQSQEQEQEQEQEKDQENNQNQEIISTLLDNIDTFSNMFDIRDIFTDIDELSHLVSHDKKFARFDGISAVKLSCGFIRQIIGCGKNNDFKNSICRSCIVVPVINEVQSMVNYIVVTMDEYEQLISINSRHVLLRYSDSRTDFTPPAINIGTGKHSKKSVSKLDGFTPEQLKEAIVTINKSNTDFNESAYKILKGDDELLKSVMMNIIIITKYREYISENPGISVDISLDNIENIESILKGSDLFSKFIVIYEIISQFSVEDKKKRKTRNSIKVYIENIKSICKKYNILSDKIEEIYKIQETNNRIIRDLDNDYRDYNINCSMAAGILIYLDKSDNRVDNRYLSGGSTFKCEYIIKAIKYMVYKFVHTKIFNNVSDMLIPVALVDSYRKYYDTYKRYFNPNEFIVNFNNGLHNILTSNTNIMDFMNKLLISGIDQASDDTADLYSRFVTGYTLGINEENRERQTDKIVYHLNKFSRNIA
jgi:hypothetical protein